MNILIFLSSTSAFLNLYQLQALYPWLVTKYAATLPLAGWLNMACLLGMMVTAPFAHRFARGFLPQKIIITGLSFLGLLNLGVAFSGSIEILFFIRLLQGLILPYVLTATMTMVGGASNDSLRLQGVSCYVAGTILGSTLSRFYPAYSVDLLGWHGGFITSAGIIFLICFFIWKRISNIPIGIDKKPTKETACFHNFKKALKEKELLIAYGIGFGLLYSQSSIFTVLGLYLSQPPLNQTSEEIGLLYLACLPALLAVFISPKLHKQQREKTVGFFLVTLLWVSVLLMGSHYVSILIGVAGFAISTYLMQTQTTRMISKARRVPVALASGLYLSFYYAGGALGANISALTFYHWGWTGAIISVAMMQVFIIVFIILISRFFHKEAILYARTQC
ncbi:MFS transporter [Halomonas piscis]|uniref:MFS transporter n=1 Tax=Halomonas piscis TaxID=3031727 RepID=UPI00289B2FC1|nr:MFS transporter [Halomonas piscis]